MKVAHDIFAEVNPAFCTYVLIAFIDKFIMEKKTAPELPLAYLALPIALSGDLTASFDGTNKSTGLREWIERSPQIHVSIHKRINLSMSIVKEAICFGCFTRALKVDQKACLLVGENRPKKTAINELSTNSKETIRRAEKLGYWFSGAGSSKTVFNIMGVSI